MPYSYTEIGAVQSRQDSVAISLGPIVVHSDAEVFYGAHFPYGLSGVATNLMSAVYHGVLGGGGEKTIGAWTSGNSVVTGSSGASCRLAQWARGIFGTDVIEGAFASAAGYSGKFRFTVPEPPEGCVLESAKVRIWSSGYNDVNVETVEVGVGTFEYDCPIYSGTVTIHPCHELIENYFSGGWYVMNGYLDSQGWNTNIWDEGGSLSSSTKTFSAQLEISYSCEEDPDNGEEATDITDTEADLEVYNDCEEAWFEYGIMGQEIVGFSSTPHQYTQGHLTFHLTGLTPCTWYWYRFKQICGGVEKTGKTYWFKTKCTSTLEAITLGAEDWWWMGGGQGTIRGLIKHTGNMNFYGYFGFQFGTNSTFTAADTVWLGNRGNESSSWIPPDPYLWPYQHTYNHLLPDRTYYYRAVWHHGRPPMTVDLYGATMSFSGVQSIAGFGYNHVTAKKAEDDISKMAAGRYYIDKSGVFQYESYQRRLA